MAKRKPIDPVEQQKMALESEMQDILKRKRLGILPLNPTRQFIVGERVQWGFLEETYIREVHENGLFYKIESLNVKRTREKEPENEIRFAEWIEIFKYNQNKPTTFRKPEEYLIRYANSGIESLLNLVYFFGVDFDVDYQRDHTWTLDDKIALIESIYNNVDIGKFVFAVRPMGSGGKLYEVIDGKQRLTAICEFIEGRYQYKGYYFAELSGSDKHKIRNHAISYGYLEDPSKRAIYETFIKLNTAGRPMKNEDIDKVKKLLENLKD